MRERVHFRTRGRILPCVRVPAFMCAGVAPRRAGRRRAPGRRLAARRLALRAQVVYSSSKGMRKVKIVTGASSGIGYCFSLSAAEENGRGEEFSADELWVFARREDRLSALKDAVEREAAARKESAPEVRVFPADISGREGALRVREIFEREAEHEKFTITLLVNNAGFGTYGEFAKTDGEREMRMIEVDCTSLTGITSFSLPYMSRGSRIINVASLAAFLPLGNFSVYAACKSYVLSFSISLRAELRGRGISVTAVCPGSVQSEFALVASNGARREVLHGKSAEETARHALAASRRGKAYSIKYLSWKAKAFASRFVPRNLGASFTYRFCKRPSN